MTKDERIRKLAEYFTGPIVVVSSIGLQLGGDRAVAANAFFDARNAVDVSGYMTADEAEIAIKNALEA
jgi:hypothetical protein